MRDSVLFDPRETNRKLVAAFHLFRAISLQHKEWVSETCHFLFLDNVAEAFPIISSLRKAITATAAADVVKCYDSIRLVVALQICDL